MGWVVDWGRGLWAVDGSFGSGIAEGVGGDAVVEEVLGEAVLEVVGLDSDVGRGEVGVEEDSVDGAVVVPSGGKDEEVAAIEVADGVKLDILEAGLMLYCVLDDLVEDCGVG